MTIFAVDISRFIYRSFIRNINVITIQKFIPFCHLKFTNDFTNISIRNNSPFVIKNVWCNLCQYLISMFLIDMLSVWV